MFWKRQYNDLSLFREAKLKPSLFHESISKPKIPFKQYFVHACIYLCYVQDYLLYVGNADKTPGTGARPTASNGLCVSLGLCGGVLGDQAFLYKNWTGRRALLKEFGLSGSSDSSAFSSSSWFFKMGED